MRQKKNTCNLTEALKILKDNGFFISYDVLSNALKADAARPAKDRFFPFGVAIKCGEHSSRYTYIIYMSQLKRFIRERAEEGCGE